MFVNLGHGQNGFLTAALFAGALVTLERRPGTAGVLFGLLAYKPQFGLMIPLALLAAGRWRAIAAAAATVAAMLLATMLAFGLEIWRAFFDSTKVSRAALLESGEVGWHKMQSVLSWVRMWGGSVQAAYAIHGAVALSVAGSDRLAVALARRAIRSRRRRLSRKHHHRAHSHDYDLMVLAPAIAFLAVDGMSTRLRTLREDARSQRHGWRRWSTRTVAQVTLVPLGVIAMLAVPIVLRRARSFRAAGHPAAGE